MGLSPGSFRGLSMVARLCQSFPLLPLWPHSVLAACSLDISQGPLWGAGAGVRAGSGLCHTLKLDFGREESTTPMPIRIEFWGIPLSFRMSNYFFLPLGRGGAGEGKE